MTDTHRSARRQPRRSAAAGRPFGPTGLLIALCAALAVAAVVLLLANRDEQAATGAGAPVEQFMHVHGLAVPAWSPEHVYVSTHHGLIRIDAEGRWRYVSDDPHDFMGFAVHPSEEGVLYTSGHPALRSGLRNPLGFMVSIDGGRSWQPRSLHGEVDFHAMAVHHANGDVIYGWDATAARVLRSEDGGRSWQPKALPDSDGVLALAAHPTDPDTVLAGTFGGLFLSRDGGRIWQPLISDAPVTAVAYDPTSPERVFAYVAHADGGLIETGDGGRSWTSPVLQLGDDVAGHIAIHPTDGGIVYVGTHQAAVHRTFDGGTTWQQLADAGVPGRTTS